MKRQGFTLIEILVVIVIIGILAAIILGLARNAQGTAARKKAEAEISSISSFITDYQVRYGRVPSWPDGKDNETRARDDLMGVLKTNKHALTNFTDPWGKQYHYKPSSPVTFYLWSSGPTTNLNDRIGNVDPDSSL